MITQDDKAIINAKAVAGRNKILTWIKVGLATVLVLGFARTGFMQDIEKRGKVVKTATNVVSGEISGITKKYISVVYQKDSEKGIDYEMLLPIDKDIKFEFRKGVEEAKVGDKVSIQYEDNTVESPDKKRAFKRGTKIVRFVKTAQ